NHRPACSAPRLGPILSSIRRRTMHRHTTPPPATRIGYENNQIVAPDDPIIPLIEGDGPGADIWRATQHVIDGTLAKVYGSKKKIHWFEVLAGDKAKESTGDYLPEEALDSIRHLRVAIKGPLSTPVGGGLRPLDVTRR